MKNKLTIIAYAALFIFVAIKANQILEWVSNLFALLKPFIPFGATLIVFVLVYASIKNWGKITYKDGVLGVPGGAIAVSPPLWELFFTLAFVGDTSPTGRLLFYVGATMLTVRTMLNPTFFLALFLRIIGVLKAIICMDNRTWEQAKDAIGNFLHGGACGAFATLTYWGAFPLLPFIAFAQLMGVQVPLPVAILGMFPLFFLFAKHWPTKAVATMSDLWSQTERPGQFISSTLLGFSGKETSGWMNCEVHIKH